jgi:TRAP-type C4-dicarboxylate transport system substrate-binding protein/Tol biopolymer transport system component
LEFKGHTAEIYDIDVSPDGKYLATGSVDTTARLWDLASGEPIRTFSGHTGPIDGIAFSPDGKTLVTGSADHTARLWDVMSGETIRVFSGHTAEVGDVEFSPDGQLIVSSSGDQTARIWDIATGATLHILSGHSSFLTRVTYSPDGKYVLTGSGDDTARLWDAATGAEVHVFTGHTDNISAIAFSPDSKYAVTGGDDQVVKLWDIVTGQLVREFSGHRGWVSGLEFSPDGQLLLTGSGDRTARLWDVATGQVIHVFNANTELQDVAFSPDGQLVMAAGNDRIARAWNLQVSSAGTPQQNQSSTTLQLAVADAPGRPSEPYVLEFIEQVKTLSDGDITIEPIWQAGSDTTPVFEQGVAKVVKEGQYDLGLAGSRAWDSLGITSFQALQAPFLITDDALAEAVASSDIAKQMLNGLLSANVIGLALWPEDLRHPFSVIPGKSILSPEDFKGETVKVVPSEVSHLLIETFGGNPMFGDEGYQAAESGLRQGFSLTGTPTATGNVIFFPKFQVLFVNGAAFEKLGEAQQNILREAAIATQKKAIAEHPREVDAATAWCADGGTIVLASQEQVAAFEAAAKSVFDKIEEDPLNTELIAEIRELKAKTAPVPGAEACGPATAPQGAAPSGGSEEWSQGPPANGVWQAEITTEDFVRMGLLGSVAEREWAGLYTITFEDGKYYMTWQGLQGQTGKCQANYELVGDVVRFIYYQTTGDECVNEVDDIQWRLDDEGLHLHLVAIKKASFKEMKAYYEAKPWQKVETWSAGLPPNGVWQVELTADDFIKTGTLKSTAEDMAGLYTLTFQDGQAKIEIHGPKITVSCMQVVVVVGDAVRVKNVASPDCDGNAYDDVQWRLDADGLHFHLVSSQAVELKAMYEAKPWQKIADQ